MRIHYNSQHKATSKESSRYAEITHYMKKKKKEKTIAILKKTSEVRLCVCAHLCASFIFSDIFLQN